MVDDGEDYINSFDHNSDMHFTLQNFSNWMRNTKRTYKFCFPIHPIVWQVVLHLIPKQEDEDLRCPICNYYFPLNDSYFESEIPLFDRSVPVLILTME